MWRLTASSCGPIVSAIVLAGCNYARGRWVQDARRRPLYSGLECKRWLSPMWACRLTQRTDFSYESFRWQPESCEIQEFDPDLSSLARLRGKTIALVGDSLGRQQFQSLMCMLTGGKEAPEARGAIRPDGWAYRFFATNTTILYYWSASLCELEPLNRSDPAATRYAMHLDRPAAFLRQHIGRFDVLVLNTGHHWNRGKISGNRWDMYVNGAPLRDRRMAEISRAKNFTVHSVVRWLDSQIPYHPRLRAFLRSISPRHFVNGDWNSGGSCANTTPLLRGVRVQDGGAADDALAAGAVAGTGVRLLDITAISELRDEAHMSNYSLRASSSGVQDCLHWCLPGVPDTWNEILLAQL
ncbi:unnamed protein product [Spirodela intermedia]|uniref:Uncharacterized protein n=1 Tax=Spirodela intermedia TaxID=51605 RepID=A0A7I8LJ27_SPIIN|nr:unnamed protein product [Spirodela intermedia]